MKDIKMPPPPESRWAGGLYPVDLVTRADYESLAFYTRHLQRELTKAGVPICSKCGVIKENSEKCEDIKCGFTF
jgi:hypothetical protein